MSKLQARHISYITYNIYVTPYYTIFIKAILSMYLHFLNLGSPLNKILIYEFFNVYGNFNIEVYFVLQVRSLGLHGAH